MTWNLHRQRLTMTTSHFGACAIQCPRPYIMLKNVKEACTEVTKPLSKVTGVPKTLIV